LSAPIPDELVFTTPAADPSAVREQVDLKLDDRILVAYRPKDAILGLLTTAGSRDAGLGDMVLATMTFLRACLDEAGFRHVSARLNDPGDTLQLDHVVSIMETLVKHWLPGTATTLSKAGGKAPRNAVR
jgi:hypothetical protein